MKKSSPFDDRDDYELMRTLNEQYESNFLKCQKLWFSQDNSQTSNLEKEVQEKPSC